MTHIGKVALKKSSILLSMGNVFTPPEPPVFSVQYQAVIDRATALGYAKPSLHQQILQDSLMQSWVTSGVFAKADLIYVLANDVGLDFGRINWKTPGSYLLTNVGTDPVPVKFMPNYGAYTNTESLLWGGLDTLWMPSIGVNFTLNSNSLVSCVRSYYGGCGMPYRTAATGDQCVFYGLDGVRVYLNNSPTSASAGGTHNNHNWMVRRTAAAVSNLNSVNAGVSAITFSSVNPSVSRNAAKLGLLGDMHNGLGVFGQGTPMEAIFVGGALTDPEFVNQDTALLTYLNAIRYVAGIYATGNYTVPAGITQLLVECWGGAGAGRGYINATATSTGGGGGGGAYAASLVNVTPGAIIPVVVGAGGVGGTGAGPAGGDTSWNGGVVLAKGGAGAPTSTTRAAGGLASASVGTTKFSGGLGGAGGAVLATSTGSGGSAAGSLADGINGIDAFATAIAVRGFYRMLGGGPPGLLQSNAADLNGGTGMMGSGGGGARRLTVTKNGGNGGQGWIRVSAPKAY